MVNIELTQEDVKTLATLINLAVLNERGGGIQAVMPAARIIAKMEAAMADAQAQQPEPPEQKDEDNA